MLERLFLTLLIIALGWLAFQVFQHKHRQRVSVAAALPTQPALLYFRSDTCAPCHTQAMFLEPVTQKFRGRVLFEKIDADIETERACQYGVFTLPTTILVDGQGIVKQINYGLTDSHKLSRQLETIL
jgi:thioredoxin-like negative regulator of GroEL